MSKLMRTCMFCGKESYSSSSCAACGFIRNRVKDFDRISPGGSPIDFEAYLKEVGCRQEPSLAMLSKIMNEVLRGGNGRPGMECKERSNGYFGVV